jgi:hypothetical protein
MFESSSRDCLCLIAIMFKSVRGKAFPLAALAAPAEPPEVRPPLGTRPRLRLKCIIRRALVGARFARQSLRVGHVEGRQALRTLVLPVLVHPAEGANRTRLSNFRILVAPCASHTPPVFPFLSTNVDNVRDSSLQWPRGGGFPRTLPRAVTGTVDHPLGSPSL